MLLGIHGGYVYLKFIYHNDLSTAQLSIVILYICNFALGMWKQTVPNHKTGHVSEVEQSVAVYCQ